jgi:hypothetical protein
MVRDAASPRIGREVYLGVRSESAYRRAVQQTLYGSGARSQRRGAVYTGLIVLAPPMSPACVQCQLDPRAR